MDLGRGTVTVRGGKGRVKACGSRDRRERSHVTEGFYVATGVHGPGVESPLDRIGEGCFGGVERGD